MLNISCHAADMNLVAALSTNTEIASQCKEIAENLLLFLKKNNSNTFYPVYTCGSCQGSKIHLIYCTACNIPNCQNILTHITHVHSAWNCKISVAIHAAGNGLAQ